jgi:hypothetical protein
VHPDQQLWIDRGAADVAIERAQLLVQVAKYIAHEDVDSSQEMTLRDHVFEAKLVEKAPLVSIPSTHHRRIS